MDPSVWMLIPLFVFCGGAAATGAIWLRMCVQMVPQDGRIEHGDL